jgi:serine/threonine protein kinase
MQDRRPYSFEKLHSEHKVIQPIGGGKFGQVFKVLHRPSDAHRALKTVTCKTERDVRDVLQEIQIMEQLDHPRVVKVLPQPFSSSATTARTTSRTATTPSATTAS